MIARCYLQCYVSFKLKIYTVLITCNLIFSSDRIDCHILASFYLRTILIEYFVWQSAVGWISRWCIIWGFEHCVWECQSVYWIIQYTAQSVYWRQAVHLSYVYFAWKYWTSAYLIWRSYFYCYRLLKNIIWKTFYLKLPRSWIQTHCRCTCYLIHSCWIIESIWKLA